MSAILVCCGQNKPKFDGSCGAAGSEMALLFSADFVDDHRLDCAVNDEAVGITKEKKAARESRGPSQLKMCHLALALFMHSDMNDRALARAMTRI